MMDMRRLQSLACSDVPGIALAWSSPWMKSDETYACLFYIIYLKLSKASSWILFA